jgi:hypothetical protein
MIIFTKFFPQNKDIRPEVIRKDFVSPLYAIKCAGLEEVLVQPEPVFFSIASKFI